MESNAVCLPGFDELYGRWQRTLGFSEAPAAAAPADASYRPPSDPPAALPTAEAAEAGFVKLAEIGSGGQGCVYQARQSHLRREVAVKQLRPGQVEQHRADFLVEAVTTAQLEHPNIVPVHVLDFETDGQPSLVMKLVAGQSWRERLAQQPDLRADLEVLIQVCNAVAYAHSRGIVHNDLKPANVMLGRFGEVLVLDWGLAVDLQGDRPFLRAARSIESPCGTPCYSPPELAIGRGADIGPWTDVYLLGAILFELLTGRPPHGGRSLLDCLRLRCDSDTLDFGEAAPPAELAALCRQALSPAPEQRPDAERFRDGLRDYMRHAESLQISAQARRTLAGLAEGAARDEAYERYNLAIAGFQQARLLWPGNQPARAGEVEARSGLARTALERGDLTLAASHARRLQDGPGSELLAAVEAAQAAQQRESRNRRWLRGTALVLAGALLLSLTLGLLWLRAKNRQLQLGRTLEASSHQLRRLEDRLAERLEAAELLAARAEVERTLGALASWQEEFPAENALPYLRGLAWALLHRREDAQRELSRALALPDSDWSRQVGVRERASYARARVGMQALLVSTLAYSPAQLQAQTQSSLQDQLPRIEADLAEAGRSHELEALVAGWRALLRQDLPSAQTIVQQLRARGGPSAEAATLAALVELRGPWRAELATVDRALSRNANQPLLLLFRAVANQQHQRHDAAFADLERALLLEPTSLVARQFRVQLLIDARRLAEATEAIDAWQDDPVFAAGARAEIALRGKDYPAAIAATDVVIAHDPAQPAARRIRALALAGQGERAAALRELDQALRLSDDWGTRALRAELRHADGQAEAAEADARQLVAARPGHPMGWTLLGTILASAGQAEEALDCFDTVLRLEPHNPHALFGRAELHGQHPERRAAALADLELLLQLQPEHRKALELRARLADERYVRLDELQRAIAQQPSFELLNQRFNLHRELGLWPQALADVELLAATEEGAAFPFELHFVRADCLHKLGQVQAALAELQRARETARDDDQREAVDRAIAMVEQDLPE